MIYQKPADRGRQIMMSNHTCSLLGLPYLERSEHANTLHVISWSFRRRQDAAWDSIRHAYRCFCSLSQSTVDTKTISCEFSAESSLRSRDAWYFARFLHMSSFSYQT